MVGLENVGKPFGRKNRIQSGSFRWERTKHRVNKGKSGMRKMPFGHEIPADISGFEIPATG